MGWVFDFIVFSNIKCSVIFCNKTFHMVYRNEIDSYDSFARCCLWMQHDIGVLNSTVLARDMSTQIILPNHLVKFVIPKRY